jgi:hypothetical protein
MGSTTEWADGAHGGWKRPLIKSLFGHPENTVI